MFSSNQILCISGDIHHENDLKNALQFALEKYGDYSLMKQGKVQCVYQITEDNKYCLGWASEQPKSGWNTYPFDFDIDIIAKIIQQYIEKQEIERDIWDGHYSKGFLLESIRESLNKRYDRIENPFYGIITIKPYTCFYSK